MVACRTEHLDGLVRKNRFYTLSPRIRRSILLVVLHKWKGWVLGTSYLIFQWLCHQSRMRAKMPRLSTFFELTERCDGDRFGRLDALLTGAFRTFLVIVWSPLDVLRRRVESTAELLRDNFVGAGVPFPLFPLNRFTDADLLTFLSGWGLVEGDACCRPFVPAFLAPRVVTIVMRT